MKVAALVEGDGEVAALPLLLRRLSEWRSPAAHTDVLTPIRIRRDRFLNREDEFRRHVLLAAAKSGDNGWILMLLDADDDCPARSGPQILTRAQAVVPHRRVSVVLANREYEAWFIASAEALHGHRGFVFDPSETIDAETPRDAKGWVRVRMPGRAYGETTDQPALTARMDLSLVFSNSRSFRKLCAEWDRQVARI